MKPLKLFAVKALIVSLLSSIYIQAQAQSRWSVAPTTSLVKWHPSYYFNQSGQSVPDPTYGYSVGVMGQYQLSPKWSLSSGVAHLSIKLDGDGSNFLRNNYLQVPLYINLRPSLKRLSPYLTAGISWISHQRLKAFTKEDGHVRELPLDGVLTKFNYKRVYGVVGVGASYRLNNHFSITAQPIFSYKFRKEQFDVNNSDRYTVSLQAQLVYTF
ncbi:hypothetical protein GCM10023187_51870 [Nibrella viscosa]|uniref:Outer membrane protein beta-barrel domain-containing protein n=1 Tax=Nibrella viscosa TaxID=1084524 RepID=A0ABP8KY19_9BACT